MNIKLCNRNRNTYKYFVLLIYNALYFSCKTEVKEKVQNKNPAIALTENKVQVQGHRGERGYLPENSIPGFIGAIEKGVDVIELDVVISADNKVVVSHEPYMSSVYMSNPSGHPVPREMEKKYNLYQMTYDSIRRFDSGSRGNANFPEQRKLSTYKPLLSAVIDTVEKFTAEKELPTVGYNIELKSNPEVYGEYQPEPEVFVDLVMEVLKSQKIKGPVNIQSFDPEILKIMHAKYPEITLAYLVFKPGISKNLEYIGFTPEIYSPSYGLVSSEMFVDSVKSKNMKLIPWTVNDTSVIKRMISLKVDGIITDYPDRVISSLQ